MRRRAFLNALVVAPALLRPRTGARGRVLDVSEFGAAGDGRSDDTGAITRAVQEATPDDTVWFPGGVYLVDAVDLGRFASPRLTLAGGAGAVIRKHPEGAFDSTNRTHVFYDTSSGGSCDGLCVHDLTFDLSRSRATAGDTVSAFYLNRVDGVEMVGCRVSDGVEEGLKLYKCRDVWISRCTFERIRNNGVQVHAPPAGYDGYTGPRPNRGWRNVRISRCTFRDIDDGLGGARDGQGVTFNSTDAEVVCEGGAVVDCEFDRCVRGVWAEMNDVGVAVRDLAISRNRITRSVAIGAGVVGALDVVIEGNDIRDTASPAARSDTLIGVIVSGSDPPRPRSERVRVTNNRIVDERGPDRRMRHGIVVRNAVDVELSGNTVRGATAEAIRVEPSAERVRMT